MTEAHDVAIAAAKAHAIEGRTQALDKVARARAGVEAAMQSLRDASDQHDRALALFSTFQKVIEGRPLFFAEITGGAFSVGNHLAYAVDHSELMRPMRARLDTVDGILARVSTPVAPAPEPEPDDGMIDVYTADYRAVRRISKADAAAPVGSKPSKPAA